MHVDDVTADDNGQELINYDFANDGFRVQPNTGHHGRLQDTHIPPAVRGGVDWMRKLAFRYRRIKEVYNEYRGNVEALMSDDVRFATWHDTLEGIDEISDGWLNTARLCLHLISQR